MSNLVPKESEFILYTTPQGDVRLDVLVLDESIWLTQKSMADLWGFKEVYNLEGGMIVWKKKGYEVVVPK